MDYEIIKLKEKTVVGYAARTNNLSPDMGAVIGGLWERLYGAGNYESIQGKVNEKALGIYTDYEKDEKADYTVLAACEVDKADVVPTGMTTRVIPAGTYARFIVKGHMEQAVAQFWQEMWQIELNRSFQCDFEEYQNGDMENCEIHIYIGLNE